MSVVNLFLDPLDATNPTFVNSRDNGTLFEQPGINESNSDSEFEHESPTPRESPGAKLRSNLIVPRHAPGTILSAWEEVVGFSDAILGELEDNSRSQHLSSTERHAKSQKLKARFGDLSASDRNPLKTVVYSKSREILEEEEKNRAAAAAWGPKWIQAKLTPSGSRKRIRTSDRQARKYTWKFPAIKNKGKMRARRQSMMEAKAMMNLKSGSENQETNTSSDVFAVNMIASDEEDTVDALSEGASDFEGKESEGQNPEAESEDADKDVMDVESEAEAIYSRPEHHHKSIHGFYEDRQSPDTSSMDTGGIPLRFGVTATTNHQIFGQSQKLIE